MESISRTLASASSSESANGDAILPSPSSNPPIAVYWKNTKPLTFIEEVIAIITLGMIMSWYYFVTFYSVGCILLAIFSPAWRIWAITGFVLMWSSLAIPLDHEIKEGFIHHWIFDIWRSYFDFEYINEQLPNNDAVLYAIAPHGVLPWGSIVSCACPWKPARWPEAKVPQRGKFEKDWKEGKVRIPLAIAASVLFKMPGLRHFFSALGCRTASKKDIANIFNEGFACSITIGGIAEIFLIDGKKERLYIQKHKGFVREAIKNGANIIPVFTYGNTSLFKILHSKGGKNVFQRLSQKLQASIVFFYGRFFLPIPFRHPLKYVNGLAIPVKKNPDPTPEEVNALHALFCKRLTELYYRHRPEWETRELSIE